MIKSFRKFKICIACMALFTICIICTGCSSDEKSAESSDDAIPACNLVILTSHRSNSTASLEAAAKQDFNIENYLDAAANNSGSISLIRLDGNPEVLDTYDLTSSAKNSTRKKQEINAKISEFKSVLSSDSINANSSEVDIFKAFKLANECLPSNRDNLKNIVIIADSGISTSGVINFTNTEGIDALYDCSSFASSLVASGQLTKFNNIDQIIWLGLGKTSSPESTDMCDGTVSALEKFYTSIFKQAGIDDVSFYPSKEEKPDANLPSVTVVNLPYISTYHGVSKEFKESNTNLTFTTGTCNFADESKASEELSAYIEDLIQDSTLTVVIRGYADPEGDEASNKVLSQNRADAVKALMVKKGVSSSKITTIGMGEDSTYTDNAQNRRVELVFS